VVRIGPSGVGRSDVEQQMKDVVAGELSPLETLDAVTDWALVSKVRDFSVRGPLVLI
jgi:hypothetical protein